MLQKKKSILLQTETSEDCLTIAFGLIMQRLLQHLFLFAPFACPVFYYTTFWTPITIFCIVAWSDFHSDHLGRYVFFVLMFFILRRTVLVYWKFYFCGEETKMVLVWQSCKTPIIFKSVPGWILQELVKDAVYLGYMHLPNAQIKIWPIPEAVWYLSTLYLMHNIFKISVF